MTASPVHIDFETFSRADLITVGAHRYAVDPSTEALCIGISLGPDEAPNVIDLSQNPRPAELSPLFDHIQSGGALAAHNAEFERSIVAMMSHRHGWPRVRRTQWDCTAARAVAAGFPRSLNNAAVRVGLPVAKDPRGVALIKRFCMPQKDGARILPSDDVSGFTALTLYCQQDVVVEKQLDKALPVLHPFERNAYLLDALINDRGYPIDIGLVDKAIVAVKDLTDEVTARVEELTNGIRPTQRNAILAWIQEEGASMGTLQAQEIGDMLAGNDLPASVREVLSLRLEASRAGLAKLDSMRSNVCPDGRVRGGFLYYGAHTGRWSGQRVQPHNFARGNPEEQDRALDLLDLGGADYLRMFYPNPLMVLSQSIRGFIAAPPGNRWLIADYAAIEARILAWLAGEESMLVRYRKGVDLYRWMAARLYGGTETSVTGEQRRIGKNLILGCGYSLGGPSFVDYCARAGIAVDETFAMRAVSAYREMAPNVVAYWRLVENAAIAAVRHRGREVRVGPVRFLADRTALRIFLPSGRPIVYQDPGLEEVTSKYGARDQMVYFTTFRGQWVPERTYGGKLTENIVSGTARDVMVVGMLNAEQAGYPVNFTVHDEIGTVMPEGEGDVAEFGRIISQLPPWATGLPLEAKSFETRRYRKD